MTEYLFIKNLTRASHVHSFVIRKLLRGWEVSETEDRCVLEQRQLTDWHRVERACLRFAHQTAVLRESGWSES